MIQRITSTAALAALLLIPSAQFSFAGDSAGDIQRALMPNLDHFERAYQKARASAANDGVTQPGGRSRSWGAPKQRTRGYHSEVPRLDQLKKKPKVSAQTPKTPVPASATVAAAPKKPSYSTAQITFQYNSAELTPEARAILVASVIPALNGVTRSVAQRTRSMGRGMQADVVFTVVGHTDASGSEEYNQTLSERRAQAVCDFIRANGYNGVPICRGEGERLLANPARPDAEENRRVEIQTAVYPRAVAQN